MINIQELEDEANKFLSKYNLELEVPIKLNGRLTSTLGRFTSSKGEPLLIELSKELINYGCKDFIIDTLLHECLHYALYVTGKPYKDDSQHFISEAKKHGIGLTGTAHVGYAYHVKCNSCGKEDYYYHKRYADSNKYVSGCCKSEFKLIGTSMSDGCVITFIDGIYKGKKERINVVQKK